MKRGPTLIVEPNPSGHRFQWVSHVARAAIADGDPVILLTSAGASALPQFANFLGDLDLEVIEHFDDTVPDAEAVGEALVDVRRRRTFAVYVILDADTLLRSWWRVAPRSLRRSDDRVAGVLMMSRYPPRFTWSSPRLVLLKLTKTAVALLALTRRVADRVLYIAGRDETEPGRLLTRVRDPAICSHVHTERHALRARFGLPEDRRLIGVIGSVTLRKSVPMVLEAARLTADDVDVLVAGTVDEDVRRWLDGLPPADRARVHDRVGFLSDDDIDAYVATSDVIAVAHLNPGPSGIMGKALAAGVPVLTTSSKVRRREAEALGLGLHSDHRPDAMAEGFRTLLSTDHPPVGGDVPIPTAEEFGTVVLGGGR